MLALLLACFFGTMIAAPSSEECPRIMSEAGVSEMFAPLVAHSIHSITVEDIRYYFKPDVTEDNGIPTVNMDLASEDRVLPNAPLVGYDEDFSTMSLKSFDMVMRNMNRTWWGITNYSVLEKVAHALHMAEMWTNAQEEYKFIEKLLDPESDICACVTDIENNDILNYLNLLAFKIKYPGITSGNSTVAGYWIESVRNGTDAETEDTHIREKRSPGRYTISGSYSRGGYSISGSYSRGRRLHYRSLNFDDVDFQLSDVELIKDVAEKLMDGEQALDDHLDSADNWPLWKGTVKVPANYPGHYDLAMFMFCSLN